MNESESTSLITFIVGMILGLFIAWYLQDREERRRAAIRQRYLEVKQDDRERGAVDPGIDISEFE